MSLSNRLCSLNLLLVALFVLAVVAILLAILPKSQFRQLTSQQAAAEAIQRRGSTVVLGPSRKDGLPPDVISVILDKAVVDTKWMQTLGEFDTLLSSNTPEANRMVVSALLRNADVSESELASVAKKIRDQRTTKERMDE